ncbi:hypothetical protein H0H92_012493 [Tricholoma furcatifolium]|nr:hypothetical protein H0H92_012493 [Tricholoma furcatifolium]
MSSRVRFSETQEAVHLQIELETAKEDLSRFKQCQNSSIYAHAQPKVREILDTERKKHEQTVRELDRKVEKSKALLEFLYEETQYDVLMRKNRPEDIIDSYIAELSSWSDSLREILAKKHLPQSPLGPDDPATWSYEQINRSLEEMNTLLDRSIETELSDRYFNFHGDARNETKREDVEAMVRRLRRLQVKGEDVEEWERLESHLEEAERLVGHSRYVYEAKEKLALLIEKQDAELAQLKSRLDHVEGLGIQMKQRLIKYAQTAKEDAAKIDALKERIAYLHSLPNPAIQPSEETLDAVKTFLEGWLGPNSDLNPANIVSNAVASTSEVILKSLEDQLRQIDETTEAIYERFRTLETGEYR